MNGKGIGGRLSLLERAINAGSCPASHVRIAVNGATVEECCLHCGRPLDVTRIVIERVPSWERPGVAGQDGMR